MTSGSTASSKVSISDIITGANTLKQYVLKYKKLPSSVTINGNKYSISVFAYLMSQAILNINAGKTSKITVIKVTNGSATGSINHRVFKSTYLSAASTVASAGVNKKVLPGSVSLDGKKAVFKLYTFGFAKILVFYGSEKMLPNYCDFDSSVIEEPKPVVKYVTIKQIANSAKNVRNFIWDNRRIPDYVSIAGTEISIPKFTYLMAKTIEKISANQTSSKIKIVSVSENYYTGDSIKTNVSAKNVLKISKYVANYSATNKLAPKYVSINGKKANFDVYTYLLAGNLYYYHYCGKLPKLISLKSSMVAEKSPKLPMKRGVNEYNTAKDLSIYLKASGRSALNSQIKSLAKSLTKNCKTTWEKANAIFKYVRDRVSYSFYYNSRKGASGTLSSKSANCCDKSNLVVALCRASNIPARYCHSTSCHFRSGLVCGHVWAQFL